MAKLAQLEKETHHQEELEKMTTSLIMELAALREKIGKAKANAVAAFRILQPFFNKCGFFYGYEFDDYLK